MSAVTDLERTREHLEVLADALTLPSEGAGSLELSVEEWREMVDVNARRLLGMSADEFCAALLAGELNEADYRVERVAPLARMMLRRERPMARSNERTDMEALAAKWNVERSKYQWEVAEDTSGTPWRWTVKPIPRTSSDCDVCLPEEMNDPS